MFARCGLESAGKVVLIVDDDAQVLKMTSLLLASAGYETVEATTPAEALALATQIKFDVLLVDAVLPGMSGPDLADELSISQVFAKIVFMSGLDPIAILMAFGKPCVVLQKPFSSKDLLSKIRLPGKIESPGAVVLRLRCTGKQEG